jgi:hypothetical protein
MDPPSRVPSRRSCLGRVEVHERGIEGQVNIAPCKTNGPFGEAVSEATACDVPELTTRDRPKAVPRYLAARATEGANVTCYGTSMPRLKLVG